MLVRIHQGGLHDSDKYSKDCLSSEDVLRFLKEHEIKTTNLQCFYIGDDYKVGWERKYAIYGQFLNDKSKNTYIVAISNERLSLDQVS